MINFSLLALLAQALTSGDPGSSDWTPCSEDPSVCLTTSWICARTLCSSSDSATLFSKAVSCFCSSARGGKGLVQYEGEHSFDVSSSVIVSNDPEDSIS